MCWIHWLQWHFLHWLIWLQYTITRIILNKLIILSVLNHLLNTFVSAKFFLIFPYFLSLVIYAKCPHLTFVWFFVRFLFKHLSSHKPKKVEFSSKYESCQQTSHLVLYKIKDFFDLLKHRSWEKRIDEEQKLVPLT